MPSSLKGVIAGFFATVVLSALILIFNAAGILKELDIIEHIDKLGSIQRDKNTRLPPITRSLRYRRICSHQRHTFLLLAAR